MSSFILFDFIAMIIDDENKLKKFLFKLIFELKGKFETFC